MKPLCLAWDDGEKTSNCHRASSDQQNDATECRREMELDEK